MSCLLIALALYVLPAGTHVNYDVTVGFDGYLPVLGGRTAKADVAMSVEVVGLAPSANGNLRASSDIKELQLTYNGAVMPFGVANVQEFYPKATIEFTPQGKLIKTDVPDRAIPFRMPGLDSKRLQDITYLPLEFPITGIEESKSFKFKKQFGDSPVEYDVTPLKIDDAVAKFSIKLNQQYTSYEDASHNESDESAADSKVVTTLTGDGTATFDLKRGLMKDVSISAVASGHVVNLKTQATSERQLKTKLKVALSPKS